MAAADGGKQAYTDHHAGLREPQVTVVCPTRNRWPMLSRALRTALAQDVVLEVVIVDDASEDETPQRLLELDDSRVRSIRHDSREGVARSRNDGIAVARAPWIAFIDDDDLWAPCKLRRQLAAAQAADAGWCWSAYVAVDAALRPLGVTPAASPEDLARRLLRNNCIGAPSGVIARTDLVRALGGFDSTLSGPEDWDMWIRLAAEAPGVAVAEVLWAYVQHGANMFAGSDPAEARSGFELMAAKHGAAAEHLGVSFGSIGWTVQVASHHRHAGRRFRAAATYVRSAISDRSAGQLARAVLALGGEDLWQQVRARMIGRPHAPPWLTELAIQTSAPPPPDPGAV
ncbi:MAG: glycosyltransferase family 2 protein [Solirubrobacteraceae bacterium]